MKDFEKCFAQIDRVKDDLGGQLKACEIKIKRVEIDATYKIKSLREKCSAMQTTLDGPMKNSLRAVDHIKG